MGLRRWMLSFLTIGLAVWLHSLPALSTPVPRQTQPVFALSIPFTTTHQVYLPLLQRPLPRVVIAAAHIDSALTGEADEALLLWNLDETPHTLAGWQIRANGRTATVPLTSTLTLPAYGQLWCAREATAFQQTFGFSPGCEWRESDPAVPNLMGSAPKLTNSGGSIHLLSADSLVLDTLLYGNETAVIPGWQGAAAQLYTRGAIPSGGQVWRRKPDTVTGRPLDTDRAVDWSGDLADLAWGRQVFFPGWRIWQTPPTLYPSPAQTNAALSVAIGPDGLYAALAAFIHAAAYTLDFSLYTFEHPELTEALLAAAGRGVKIRMLLEGAPAGGIDNGQRWALARLHAAGVEILYMTPRPNAPAGYRTRYLYTHAKYAIADGVRVALGSENFTREAMPPPVDGMTSPGRRGLYLFTDAPAAVTALTAIFDADWDPPRFADLRPFDPAIDGPPPEYVLPMPMPADRPATFAEVIQAHSPSVTWVVNAPEEATLPNRILSLVARTAGGDSIDWVQLYEHKFWGESNSNPIADPNPRLQALIAAARRGVTVRVLLDSYFDDPRAARSNAATVAYVNDLAAAEGIPIAARVGNPAGLGIHAKAGLIQIGAERWSMVGSLNGGEVSHKLNRETVLLVENAEIYNRLRDLFDHDWALSAP